MTTREYFRDLRRRMLSGDPEYADALKKEKEKRRGIRAVYASEIGIKELARQCVGAGLFTKLDPDDPMSIGRHNMMVDILDDMGCLDEQNMESVVEFMLSLPLIPEGEDKE